MTRVRIGAVLLVAVLAVQVLVIVQRADREPYTDEVEYVHTAWLMSKGAALYTSFFQHHAPFHFAALRMVTNDDVPASFVRARLLSGVFALLALIALAALVWRVQPVSAPIALAILLASLPLWLLGLTAARAEPFALAFFWCGALLVLSSRNPIAGGAGIALVAIAALWNPKWPFGSLLVAAFWLARTHRRVLSAGVAVAITAPAVVLLLLLAPFDAMKFFVVDFNRALWPWLARSVVLWHAEFRGGVPFLLAPLLLRPLIVIAAFVLVVAGLAWGRMRERHIVLFFLLLTCASLLELRFIFPWPILWTHYYLMWGFAGAALIGLVPAAIEVLKIRYAAEMAFAVTVVLIVVVAANVIAMAPLGSGGDDGPRWHSMRYLQRNLRPGETVVLDVQRHPVSVADGDFYWFNFRDVERVAKELRKTPDGAYFLPERALPFCAMARGEPTKIRYVSAPRLLAPSAEEEQCFLQLLSAGRIRRTHIADVFEIVR